MKAIYDEKATKRQQEEHRRDTEDGQTLGGPSFEFEDAWHDDDDSEKSAQCPERIRTRRSQLKQYAARPISDGSEHRRFLSAL